MEDSFELAGKHYTYRLSKEIASITTSPYKKGFKLLQSSRARIELFADAVRKWCLVVDLATCLVPLVISSCERLKLPFDKFASDAKIRDLRREALYGFVDLFGVLNLISMNQRKPAM